MLVDQFNTVRASMAKAREVQVTQISTSSLISTEEERQKWVSASVKAFDTSASVANAEFTSFSTGAKQELEREKGDIKAVGAKDDAEATTYDEPKPEIKAATWGGRSISKHKDSWDSWG